MDVRGWRAKGQAGVGILNAWSYMIINRQGGKYPHNMIQRRSIE